MEELLKNISTSKTFSTAPRKLKKQDNFDFDDAQRLGINEIPQPTTVPSGKKTTNAAALDNNDQGTNIRFAYPSIFKQDKNNRFSYSEFIAKDRNIYLQRKILLQQENLQKHTAVSWASASNTKKLDTKGLQLEDELENPLKREDVTNWPQCK